MGEILVRPKNKFGILAVAVSAACVGLGIKASASPITPGSLVVYHVGANGSTTALNSAATAAFVDDFPLAGGPALQQIALPTAASGLNNPLTNSGSATSEGELTVSPNGQYIGVGGYDTAVGTTGVASSTTIPRVAGIIPVSTGVPDTSTTLGAAFLGNNPRSVITTDGTNIWAGGAGGTEATQGGVWYTTDGSSTSTMLIGGNDRQVGIYNSQLYIGSGSGTAPAHFGISAVGTGLPTTTGQSSTVIAGVDTGSSGSLYSYVMESLGGSVNPDTIYVDDTNTGISKYSLESGTWTLTGTVPVSTDNSTGLAALVVGSTVDLYFTTPTNVYELSDASGFEGSLSGTPLSIETAASDTAFRGIGVVVPEPASVSLLALGGVALLGRRRRA
jgi:hypothetical protein